MSRDDRLPCFRTEGPHYIPGKRADRSGQSCAERNGHFLMANRICAYCKKIMGPALTEEDTHGACDECAEKVLSELKLGEVGKLGGWKPCAN
jgi:DNA-directed RNA polymerase subunit RPC12/RpoP